MSTGGEGERQHCIGLKDVEEAAERIEGIVHCTPVLTSSSLDRMCGSNRRLFFKVEALQRTGSFKFRGASNAVQSLVASQSSNTSSMIQVVTHSSGNHAQALALAAQMASSNTMQVNATIVMPRNAPSIKQAAVRGYGAEVILVDNSNEAREEKADEIVLERGAAFIHPSEDPRVIAGQGTVCLELVRQVQAHLLTDQNNLDAVIIPVGGGGLAAGNTISLRGLLGDRVKIILAEPEEMDDAKRSFESRELLGHNPDNPLNSVADGLKTTLGPNTWPIVRDLVDDVMTVSERDILRCTKLIWERLKVAIEPSAGVGVAVALGDEFRQKYPHVTNVGIILCGGNVDITKTCKQMEALGL